MNRAKVIGILLILMAIAMGMFGLWLKSYNDRIASEQISETGTCYLKDGTCLHATSDSIFYAALVIAVFLAALGTYLVMQTPSKGREKAAEQTAEIKPTETKPIETPKSLSPEARQVYDAIAQSNGAVLQGEIVAKTGMNKVKVSRVLDKLEMLGIIERRRHGMSNMVVLKQTKSTRDSQTP